MKNKLLIIVCLIVVMTFAGCASMDEKKEPPNSVASSVQNEDLLSEVNTLKETIADKDNEITDLNQALREYQKYDDYQDILAKIEAEEYDGAVALIDDLKKEKMKEKAGDINDYLTTITITTDNFDEYFEFVYVLRYSPFGEQVDGMAGIGLRSKKYDDGLIIYDTDDIFIEYNVDEHGPFDFQESLSYLLEISLNISVDCNPATDPLTFNFLRIKEGNVVFVSSEYVAEYNIPELSENNTNTNAEITLLNGEVITRSINPDYPY